MSALCAEQLYRSAYLEEDWYRPGHYIKPIYSNGFLWVNVANRMQSYRPLGDPQVSVGASQAIQGNELIRISASSSSVQTKRL